MKKILAGVLLSSAMALGSAHLYAADPDLYNNGSGGGNSGICNFSGCSAPNRGWVYDDFTVATDSTLTGFTYSSHFSGSASYLSTNWTIWGNTPADPDNFADGADLAGNTAGSLVGVLSGGNGTYQVTGLSFALLGGSTYWIGIQNVLGGTSEPSSTFLKSSSGGGGFAFTSDNSGNIGITSSEADFSIQGTTVSAVPEPETYAMLLAGLGMLGFMARRRKQKGAVAA